MVNQSVHSSGTKIFDCDRPSWCCIDFYDLVGGTLNGVQDILGWSFSFVPLALLRSSQRFAIPRQVPSQTEKPYILTTYGDGHVLHSSPS